MSLFLNVPEVRSVPIRMPEKIGIIRLMSPERLNVPPMTVRLVKVNSCACSSLVISSKVLMPK